jgi:hydroxypyruvate reductase
MVHGGIENAARRLGASVVVHSEPLTGDARLRGTALAQWLASSDAAGVHCWTGETTVALGGATGRGGRCQELALAAALELERCGASHVMILAAGTDGRDGPTDAAGAIVDARTATTIRAHGMDPVAALERHDAYPVLATADALLRTGLTGTNVADVVLAIAH